MTQSPTELLAEPVLNALHRALAEAWQAGYDCALMDDTEQQIAVAHEAQYLSIVKEQGE